MEKLNIAKILKDCPSGMELDCTMYENLYFDRVDIIGNIKCYIKSKDGYLTQVTFFKNGCYNTISNSKCVIFPKGKTTWEGFQRPFKDGDILVTDLGSVFILKEHNENIFSYGCYVALNDVSNIVVNCTKFCVKEHCRFAIEEEKEKLFKAIKDNGYKWNQETKILEKLPKFKVGDKITNGKYSITISHIDDNYYYETGRSTATRVSIKNQDYWRLDKFDITTLKPFDSRVLVRYNEYNKWCGAFFSHIDKEYHSFCYKYVTTAGKSYPYCIPYEGNEHLLNKTDDCDEYYKTWE